MLFPLRMLPMHWSWTCNTYIYINHKWCTALQHERNGLLMMPAIFFVFHLLPAMYTHYNFDQPSVIGRTTCKKFHISITQFWLWTLKLDPKPLNTYCTLRKNVYFNVKKGPIEGSICFKLVPGLLFPGPLFKVVLVRAHKKSSSQLPSGLPYWNRLLPCTHSHL